MNKAKEIRKLKLEGLKVTEIAKRYSISRQSVSKVINNKTFVE